MRIAVDADSLTRFEARHRGRVTIATYRALAALRPSWEFLFFHQVGALDQPLHTPGQPQATLAAPGLPTERPYLQHFGSLNPNKKDEAKRRALVTAGHARVQMFNWTRTAEAYARIFEAAARD